MNDTIIDRLLAHAEHAPDKIIYQYLERGEQITDRLSYRQLCTQTFNLSTALTELEYYNSNIVLLFSHPLEFIQAFLGCLAAGITAVPVAVPTLKNADALASIFRNAQTTCVLAGQREKQQLREMLETRLGPMSWHCIDELNVASETSNGISPRVSGDGIAFLQYTSGSTGIPKGVMVSHTNLMANEAAICNAMRMHSDSIVVSWLPHYHDMGLIGSLLQPLYLGAECILMRPVDFIQKPVRWLRAISSFGATVSGGPNFAFDLCVDRINEELREGLDLSRWNVAFSGAEPVRASTLARFSSAFASCNFKRTAFYPCYGMAESTLFVSGGNTDTEPSIVSCIADTLAIGEAVAVDDNSPAAVPFVSCGTPNNEAQVKIVHPETQTLLPSGHVGEIWVHSASVAKGYYNNPNATARTFCATIAGHSDKTYLRTGDVGVLHNGQLIILGRIKDVLIVRGRNYYPQDIEAAAQKAHAALASDGGAVFQRTAPRNDQIVLIHELTRQSVRQGGFEQIAEAARSAVIEQYGITLTNIVFVKPGQLPRTTSGKVRRSFCRDLFEQNKLLPIDAPEQQGRDVRFLQEAKTRNSAMEREIQS